MTTIISKNSSTAGAVPIAGDLVQGEIAVNVTDKKLYTKNASGSVVQITPVVNDNGFKNRIINGAMMIDQRNLGAAKTLTAGVQAYVLDRFYVTTNGGAGVVQQVAGTGGFTKAMRITGASGITDGYFGQKIESYNIADCASSTVTYKLRASSSALTTLTWYARFPNAQDNYVGVTLITSGSITINSTPNDYSFQIALPANVTNGFELYFTFGAFTSGTLDITGVQLEKGSTATSFDYRPYGTQLALCQRYCIVYRQSDGSNLGSGASWLNTTDAYIFHSFPVPVRVAPTGLNTSSAANYLVNGTNTNMTVSSFTFASSSTMTGRIRITGTSGTSGQPVFLQGVNSSAYVEYTGMEL